MLRTEEFIKERRYLQNVSERTVQWYEESFKWLERYWNGEQSGLTSFVMGMREAGLSPSSCNNRIRAVKAYLVWSGSNLKLSYLKEEQKVLSIFKTEDIRKIVSVKTVSNGEKRVQLLCVFLLDTGLRLEEALKLRRQDVDLENLLVRVSGKGNKQRLVPISFELRKRVWLYQKGSESEFLFGTRHGVLSKRNAHRDFVRLCERTGITPPPRVMHSLRHYFAVNYLKNGGNIYYLQRVLGHSTIRMTTRYLQGTEVAEIQAVHHQLSPLSHL